MLPNALREYEPVSAETTLAESPVSSLDVRQVSGMRPLAGDYAFDFARVAALYAGDPTLPAAWTDVIARRRGVSRPREAVAAMLDAQLARRGAPAPARQAAASLAQPNTFAIVTGQQAGAFGGPLYTLLKAITAIQLARQDRARAAGRRRAGLLGRRRGSRLGRGRELYGARPIVPAADVSPCPSLRARASDQSPP